MASINKSVCGYHMVFSYASGHVFIDPGIEPLVINPPAQKICKELFWDVSLRFDENLTAVRVPLAI